MMMVRKQKRNLNPAGERLYIWSSDHVFIRQCTKYVQTSYKHFCHHFLPNWDNAPCPATTTFLIRTPLFFSGVNLIGMLETLVLARFLVFTDAYLQIWHLQLGKLLLFLFLFFSNTVYCCMLYVILEHTTVLSMITFN